MASAVEQLASNLNFSVFAKAEEHARKEHNMTIILPSTMREMTAAIHDKT